MSYELKRLVPVIGMMSLVGVRGEEDYDAYPLPFGNYFAFANGPYCLNMWAENLQEWVRRNQPEYITVAVFAQRFAVVHDPRVPDNWLHTRKLCFTGAGSIVGWPTRKQFEEIFSFTKSSGLDHLVCGCEDDDIRPSVSSTWTQAEGGKGKCYHCKRTWSLS